MAKYKPGTLLESWGDKLVIIFYKGKGIYTVKSMNKNLSQWAGPRGKYKLLAPGEEMDLHSNTIRTYRKIRPPSMKMTLKLLTDSLT